MPPAEDQLVNILLIVVVVHLQVLVNAQVLHFSNVSIPIGVSALLAGDESICPNFKGIAQRGAQAGGILSGQVVKLRYLDISRSLIQTIWVTSEPQPYLSCMLL